LFSDLNAHSNSFLECVFFSLELIVFLEKQVGETGCFLELESKAELREHSSEFLEIL